MVVESCVRPCMPRISQIDNGNRATLDWNYPYEVVTRVGVNAVMKYFMETGNCQYERTFMTDNRGFARCIHVSEASVSDTVSRKWKSRWIGPAKEVTVLDARCAVVME